jgi:hypothetical protein
MPIFDDGELAEQFFQGRICLHCRQRAVEIGRVELVTIMLVPRLVGLRRTVMNLAG